MNKRTKKIAANTVVIILILCGITWIASLFVHIGTEYTDNAQIRQDIFEVSCRVQGFVKKVYFEEYQYVRKGDTLAVIENSEFVLRLAQAEADYHNALTGKKAAGKSISTTQNNILVSDAGIDELKISLLDAENDYNRYKNLLEKGAINRRQFEGAKLKYESLAAKLETMQRQKKSTSLVKDEQTQRLDQQEAGISVCRAALELAKLNLSYTVILAPCDGYTSRKNIREGELAMPGRSIVSIVSDEKEWVIANFRETQMENIKIGNKVEIKVDAVPNTIFKGEVSAISDATGAQYSLVQPDNSTGNFVKVEQRIPVKIILTKQNNRNATKKLRSGMNAECNVLYK